MTAGWTPAFGPILDDTGARLRVCAPGATIVRAVLLPATMKLLGERNWYLPSWLEWLPRLDHGEAPSPQAEPPADAESLPAAA